MPSGKLTAAAKLRLIWTFGGLVASVIFASVAVARAAWLDDAAPAEVSESSREATTEFIRVRHDEQEQPLSLETATMRYQKKLDNGQTVTVDLIGVVHVGEKEYYETLNQQFEQYEALLYELVAPEGTRVPAGGRTNDGANPVSGLQNGMKEMLGLEFQLDHIDYQKDNFVHADMSPEEFVESMSANEESFAKMFFKMLGSSLAAQGSSATVNQSDLLMAMFAGDRQTRMRRAMAQQLAAAELAMVAFSGKDGSTIIHHRNGKCFEVLEREIQAGKRHLGVFYGAGHLADMETRLLGMGFETVGSPQWYVAWRLTREPLETVVPDEESAETSASAANASAADVAAEESQSAGVAPASAPCEVQPQRRRGLGWFRWRR